jgi:hypothetical protein
MPGTVEKHPANPLFGGIVEFEGSRKNNILCRGFPGPARLQDQESQSLRILFIVFWMPAMQEE